MFGEGLNKSTGIYGASFFCPTECTIIARLTAWAGNKNYAFSEWNQSWKAWNKKI